MFFHQVSNTKGNVFNAYIYHNAGWKPHFHKAFEWIYLLEGQNTVSAGRQKYCLKAGDCLLLPPYALHEIHSEQENDCFIMVFSAQYVESAARLFSENEPADLRMRLSPSGEAYLKAHLMASQPRGAAMQPVPRPDVFTLKACLYIIFSEFLSQNPMEKKDFSDDRMDRLLSLIEQHYTENITLAQAARELGCNYDYLSRVFNQTYHMNFRTAVNQYRCEKALRLLHTTRQSLTDISMASGFQSIRSFNRIFREYMGISPSEYRNGGICASIGTDKEREYFAGGDS